MTCKPKIQIISEKAGETAEMLLKKDLDSVVSLNKDSRWMAGRGRGAGEKVHSGHPGYFRKV